MEIQHSEGHANGQRVPGHGGSIDNAGVQVAGDVLFVQSGYSMFRQMPGNVLMAFNILQTCLNIIQNYSKTHKHD